MSNDALKALTAKPFAASAPPPPRLEAPEPPPSCPPMTISEAAADPPRARDRMAWLVGLGFLAALGLGGLVVFPHHQQRVGQSKIALAGASLKAPSTQLVLVRPASEAILAATTPVVAPPIVPPPVVKLGAVQTFAAASGKPVYVDGTQVGVGGTRIETACGKHSASVGTGKPKQVLIPCNVWTPVTVGSPDGT
jgi:hypothetical protein